jgi:hypothetical protein
MYGFQIRILLSQKDRIVVNSLFQNFIKAPFNHPEPIRYAQGKLHEDLKGYWKRKTDISRGH